MLYPVPSTAFTSTQQNQSGLLDHPQSNDDENDEEELISESMDKDMEGRRPTQGGFVSVPFEADNWWFDTPITKLDLKERDVQDSKRGKPGQTVERRRRRRGAIQTEWSEGRTTNNNEQQNNNKMVECPYPQLDHTTIPTLSWYSVELAEGKKREVRRVFAEAGISVEVLRRVGYGPYCLSPKAHVRQVLLENVDWLGKGPWNT